MTHQHHQHGHGAGEDWHTAVHDVILPEALRGVELGDDVLEIGPGPGQTTEVLAARTARLTTVELDPAQASALAERLAGTNVDVVEGDAAALPFTDGRFSAAASFHMLHHVESDALGKTRSSPSWLGSWSGAACWWRPTACPPKARRSSVNSTVTTRSTRPISRAAWSGPASSRSRCASRPGRLGLHRPGRLTQPAKFQLSPFS